MTGRSVTALAVLLLLLAACAGPGSTAPTPTPSTPLAAAAPVTPTATPTPTPSPTPEPTAEPSPTPEPSPTFDPGPVIIPTVRVPLSTPTAIPGDPLERTLDGIGLRVNVLRGLSSKEAVDREFITQEEAAERIRGFYEAERAEIDDYGRLYTTLGILDSDTDLYGMLLGLYGEGILGFFDKDETKLYVVKDPEKEFGPPDERVYVHEFVHGLQKRHFDYPATLEKLEDNSDAADAFRALLEGDATVTELLYINEHMDQDERAASVPQLSAELLGLFRTLPHVILRSYAFPYQEGGVFVAMTYRELGWEGIDRVYEQIPQSTEQILHPDKYVLNDEPIVVEPPRLLDALGGGWDQVIQDTMGEFFLLTYLESNFLVEGASVVAEWEAGLQSVREAAAGWGGDSVTFFSGPQDESLLVATVVWDTETDAQEFFASFTFSTELRTGAQWETAGDGDSGSVMSLTGQTIFADLEADTTVLIFAPDAPTLQKVRAALDKAASPES